MPGDYSEELVEPSEQIYLDAARAKLAAHRHPFANDEATIQQVSTHPDHRADVGFVFAAGQRAILDALSSSGRLVPEGSRVEWRCAALGGSGRRDHAAEAQTRQHAAQTGHPIEYRITTPWTPAEPAQEKR